MKVFSIYLFIYFFIQYWHLSLQMHSWNVFCSFFMPRKFCTNLLVKFIWWPLSVAHQLTEFVFHIEARILTYGRCNYEMSFHHLWSSLYFTSGWVRSLDIWTCPMCPVQCNYLPHRVHCGPAEGREYSNHSQWR